VRYAYGRLLEGREQEVTRSAERHSVFRRPTGHGRRRRSVSWVNDWRCR